MPYAEFQPGNVSAQTSNQLFAGVDFSVSMMERATRNAAMLQDIEQRKARFVNEQIMDDQQIQLNRQRLAQLEGEQVVRAAKNRADVAVADGQYRAATSEAESMELNSKLLAQAAVELPEIIKKLDTAKDENEMVQVTAPFMRKYAHLSKHPTLGQRYAVIEGEVAGRLESGVQAVMMQARAAASGFRPALDAADPTAIARIRNSPLFEWAMKDPAFAAEFNAKSKVASEAIIEQSKRTQQTEDQIRINREKSKDDIKVNEAKPAFRKEAPQFLVEKAMKIDQSDKDLDDLESEFKEMGWATGPVVGFFRNLNPYDTTAQAFLAKLRATVPNLARGVFGEVGVLTDADIKNYMATLPNIKAPQDRATKLVEQLRGVLENQRSNVVGLVEGQGYKPEGIPGLLKKSKAETEQPDETPLTDGTDLQRRIDEARRRGLLR
jgi:hypothetical protein